jgi:hypothetical protein
MQIAFSVTCWLDLIYSYALAEFESAFLYLNRTSSLNMLTQQHLIQLSTQLNNYRLSESALLFSDDAVVRSLYGRKVARNKRVHNPQLVSIDYRCNPTLESNIYQAFEKNKKSEWFNKVDLIAEELAQSDISFAEEERKKALKWFGYISIKLLKG